MFYGSCLKDSVLFCGLLMLVICLHEVFAGRGRNARYMNEKECSQLNSKTKN